MGMGIGIGIGVGIVGAQLRRLSAPLAPVSARPSSRRMMDARDSRLASSRPAELEKQLLGAAFDCSGRPDTNQYLASGELISSFVGRPTVAK